MASSLPTRLYWVCKEAGRPLPAFSEDDVLDFQVTEAVILKSMEEQAKQKKEAERASWRKGHKGLPSQRGS